MLTGKGPALFMERLLQAKIIMHMIANVERKRAGPLPSVFLGDIVTDIHIS